MSLLAVLAVTLSSVVLPPYVLSSGSPSKKRCVQMDEKELTVPLEHGWNRQTIISGMGRRGIVGEVLYFAPCGKKMKTIPDVMRVSGFLVHVEEMSSWCILVKSELLSVSTILCVCFILR